VKLDTQDVCMNLDTGASVSIMSETKKKQLWPGRSLSPSQLKLQTYSKEHLVVVGSQDVQVCYENKTWFNWSKIYYLQAPGLQEVLGKYSAVFKEGLGTFTGPAAMIEVDPEATLRFCRARPLPCAMREKVEAELHRLVKKGTLEPVDYADWAAPIVAILKSDRKSVSVWRF